MDIATVLHHCGLQKKEAEVYLASLQLGKATAFNIAKRAGIKRPTCYVALNALNTKGLISISKTKKALLYQALSPKRLVQEAAFRKTQLEQILPELLALYKDHPHKPKIQILEGRAGIEQVYEESIECLEKGEEVRAFGTLAHFENAYQKTLDRWIEVMRNKRFKAREVLNNGSFEKEYIKKVRAYQSHSHLIRVVPDGTFVNDNILYADKLAIFSIDKDLFVILIESTHIVHSYRNLFDILWNKAEPASV